MEKAYKKDNLSLFILEHYLHIIQNDKNKRLGFKLIWKKSSNGEHNFSKYRRWNFPAQI